MTEREEAYRAGEEARRNVVQRAARGSHSSADAMTRMVNAAVYRYELDKRNAATETETERSESTADDSGDAVPGS